LLLVGLKPLLPEKLRGKTDSYSQAMNFRIIAGEYGSRNISSVSAARHARRGEGGSSFVSSFFLVAIYEHCLFGRHRY
jgi:hypothetical protein